MKPVFSMAQALAALAMSSAAAGSETATYTYDALGRLTAVHTGGGPNDEMAVSTGYDPAGNRSNYNVTGTGGSGLASAATAGNDAAGPVEQEAAVEAPIVDAVPQEATAEPAEMLDPLPVERPDR